MSTAQSNPRTDWDPIGMSLITVNGNTIDLGNTEVSTPDTKHSNFVLIQGYGAFTVEQRAELARCEVEIMEYVSENTYLCRYARDLDVIRAFTWIQNAVVYHPSLKQTVSLKEMVETQPGQEEYEVDLILHDVPNVTAYELAPFIAAAARVPLSELEIVPTKVRLTVHQDRLADLAALDSVNRIEEVQAKTWYNDQARAVLLVEEKSMDSQYQGIGQTICVADTGIDRGFVAGRDSGPLHPAFKDRIVQVFDLWDEDNGKDPIGHGTHVCGSIVGNGMYTDPESGEKFVVRGTAPGAKLMVQSMVKFNANMKKYILKQPLDLQSMLSHPYSLGVRIHSNSWGDTWKSTQLGYENDATTIDTFVYQNPDFVVAIAAGNDANRYDATPAQIGDNSAAKNVITVGATGSTRPNDGQKFSRGRKGTGITQTAAFSSRGPTLSNKDAQGQDVIGRIKPDVVAPGVAVLSPAAQGLTQEVRDRIEKDCGKSGDKDWLYMSGTSMATPLVSGCVALLREALARRGKHHPTAALIKALLVNGAINYSAPRGAAFDYEQGFGRVDVQRSISMIEGSIPACGFVDGGCPFETTMFDVPALRENHVAESRWESAEIAIPHGRNKVMVTLAYSDEPGTLLQNNINLIVQADGVERHGNMGTSSEFDKTNNVEKVIWENIQGATMKIVVAVPKDGFTKSETSGFAVAWHVQG